MLLATVTQATASLLFDEDSLLTTYSSLPQTSSTVERTLCIVNATFIFGCVDSLFWKKTDDQALARYSSPQSPMAAIKSLPLDVTDAIKALSWSSNLKENTLQSTEFKGVSRNRGGAGLKACAAEKHDLKHHLLWRVNLGLKK